MSVSTTSSRSTYSGNSIASTFAIPFRWLDDADLTVVKTVSSVDTTLVLNVDYTLTGEGLVTGGTIHLTAGALATGSTLTVTRHTALVQPIELSPQGTFDSTSIEEELDRNILIAQDQARDIDDVEVVASGGDVSPVTGASTVTATGGTTARSLSDHFANTYVALDNGVLTDGTDVSSALNTLIARASTAGGGKVEMPFGTVTIGADIIAKSNVWLCGQGWGASKIKVLAGTGDTVDTMIKGWNITNFHVSDLTIDGNNSNRTLVYGNAGIWLAGATYCTVRKNYFQDLGKTTADPSGGFITLQSWEAADATIGYRPLPGVDLPSNDNIIEDNIFDDTSLKAQFPVQVFSNFEYDIAQTAFTQFNQRNILRDNLVIGGAFVSFDLRGPATRNNVVEGNVVKDWAGYEGILVDKGASYNTVSNNQVVDWNGPSPLAIAPANPSMYRCQGYYAPLKTNTTYISYGNVFTGNVGRGFGTAASGAGAYPSCFQTNYTSDTNVTGNDFDATTNAVDGVGIYLFEQVNNFSAIGNTIRGSAYGILNGLTRLAGNLTNWNYKDNDISATTNGITVAAADAAYTITYLNIQGNTVRGTSNAGITLQSATIHNAMVKGNTILAASGGLGLGVTGDGHVFEGNYLPNFAGSEGLYLNTGTTNSAFKNNIIKLNGGTRSFFDQTSSYQTGAYGNTFSGNEFDIGQSQDHAGFRTFSATSIPASGTYVTGDRIENAAMTGGAVPAWVCHVAGTACQTSWLPSHAYVIGDRVFNNGKVYLCDTNGTSAASGGPTGTSANIVDNSTRWDYVGARALFKDESTPHGEFDPTNYGALGDGIADDTYAFTLAMAAMLTYTSPVLKLPAGTFKTNFSYTGSSLLIKGAGINVTNIIPADKTLPFFKIGDGALDTNCVTMKDFTAYGDGTGATSDGIRVYGAYIIRGENLYIHDFGRDCLRLEASTTKPTFDVSFVSCRFDNARRACVKAQYMPTGVTAWAASTAYILNDKVMNNGLIYNCSTAGTTAGSGGPTGTSTGIVDNTAHWDYVGQSYVTVARFVDCFINGYADAAAYALYSDCEISLFGTWGELPASLQGGVYLKQWPASAGIPVPHIRGFGSMLDSSNSSDTLVQVDMPVMVQHSAAPVVTNYISGQMSVDGKLKWIFSDTSAWQINHAYTLGQGCFNNSRFYVCTTAGTSAGAGGPTTNAIGIADNTAVWDYVCDGSVAVNYGDTFVYNRGRINNPDITGGMHFYLDEADASDLTHGSVLSQQGRYGGGNEYFGVGPFGFRMTGSRAYPLQFGAVGAAWQGTSTMLRHVGNASWPAADSDGNILTEWHADIPGASVDANAKAGMWVVDSATGRMYVCWTDGIWSRTAAGVFAVW